MAQRKIPYLKVVEPPENKKQLKKAQRKIRWKKWQGAVSVLVLGVLAICGTYLLLDNKTYGTAREAASYTKEISDTSNYVQFAKGIIRYNRNGIVYLNKRNEEVWIQPTQIKTPMIEVKENAFAVADRGGNNILVFSKDGLKGEIETTLPIEKIAISDQGIVSAILKNENSPQIISYDAAGNILVEQQITLGTTGYPVALDMTDDGMMLAVCYLYTDNGIVESRIGYYHFGATGKEKTDNRVTADQYEGTMLADVFFMGDDRSVAVGDNAFEIYSGKDIPKRLKEVNLDQEIRSVFHSDQYFGMILVNKEKSGNELRVYNRSGELIFSKEFTGEYKHGKIDGDEVILYEGRRCSIYKINGILKFEGRMSADIEEIFRAVGVNRYYVMSSNELKVVYLTK